MVICFLIFPVSLIPGAFIKLLIKNETVTFIHVAVLFVKYSKTSMTRTSIACFTWLIRTRFLSPYGTSLDNPNKTNIDGFFRDVFLILS